MSVPVRMPPQSAWYTHVFRDTDTHINHAVITVRKNSKRRRRSRVVCGPLVMDMQRRISSGDIISAVTCERCLDIHTAMEHLLEDG